MNYFVLDGIQGFVNSMGWIEWHTIGCHIDSIRGCKLERAAQLALDNAHYKIMQKHTKEAYEE